MKKVKILAATMTVFLSVAAFKPNIALSQQMPDPHRPEVCRRYDQLASQVLTWIAQYNAQYRREQIVNGTIKWTAAGIFLVAARGLRDHVFRLVTVGAAPASTATISWRYLLPRLVAAGIAGPLFLYEVLMVHDEYRDPHSNVLRVIEEFGTARPEEACQRVLGSQWMQDQVNDWWNNVMRRRSAAHAPDSAVSNGSNSEPSSNHDGGVSAGAGDASYQDADVAR